MNLRGLCLALALCIGVDAAWRWTVVDASHSHPLPPFVTPEAALGAAPATATAGCGDWQITQQGRLPMPAGVPAAHASTLVALKPTAASPADATPATLAAFWFAGTRESAPDVGIAASVWPDPADASRTRWQPAQWVVTRESVQRGLGVAVRRIGNPLAWRDVDGRLHLYVVATGLGGWAASRVVHLRQRDPAAPQAPWTFEPERILPLTPLVAFFNTSTLVRALPQPRVDGGALLPLYFELGIKYALAVEVDPHGRLRGLHRMTQRHDVLQPTVVALSGAHALVLMRDSGPHARVAVSETRDGGLHWHDLPDAAAGNPDSSLAAVALPGGEVWVAHNPLDERRRVLLLGRMEADASPWRSQVLAQGPAGSEFSYPSLLALAGPDGGAPELWVSYTDQRQAIAHARLQRRCAEAAR